MAGLVWGITGALAASSPPAGGKVTLKIGWTVEPDSLNPFVGYEQSAYKFFHLNYDFLTGYGVEHLQTPVPELATS